uniref:LAGLIDADG endonuclease n=1 Tax=Powellomyces hirtus TaxID=109895 RepID=A0A4P8NWM3_9FUNG|nr:LAGLIDADG endonuclease [Powellomyces hirtus]
MFYNFTICWNGLVLLGTFYSKNSISYTQSAGNSGPVEGPQGPSATADRRAQGTHRGPQRSSSETTRGTSCNKFSEFRNLYAKLGHTNFINDDWLYWFIGFTEGDGAILSYNGRPQFVITQKERNILAHIQRVLDFGSLSAITQKGAIYYRFTVMDLKHILLLVLLFNGNLAITKSVQHLGRWVNDVNARLTLPGSVIYGLCLPVTHINSLFLPTLSDPWLSGFTDADGCFNVNICKRKEAKSGFRVILRFILDQKHAKLLLEFIRDLFGSGFVSIRGVDMYRYTNVSFSGLSAIVYYLKSFPLKSKKGASFTNWLKVYVLVLNKEHLTDKGLSEIRAIKKTININNSLCTKIGSSQP